MRNRLLAERVRTTKRSVLLLGPRQVGKSTLCRSLGSDVYIDLADQAEFLAYSKDPTRLRREIEALANARLIVIDEVQRVPGLLNTVQSLLDQERRLRFVLTGSSARKLKRGGANLLPGRMILERMDPLTVLEIPANFDLDRALRLGMLPGIYWGDAEATDLLGSYAEVYLREEIQAEAATKNLGGYARFLDVIAAVSGQWINYSKLSSDTEVPKETVRRFVQLLDDTLLAFRLSPFRPSAKPSRRLVQRERILLFDVGVRNALLGQHRRSLGTDQIGPVFEQWMMLQAIYIDHALHKSWRFSTYRTEAGAEVDLIIDTGSELIGLEVKSGRNVSAADTRGLGSFEEVVGGRRPLRKIIAYRGARAQRIDRTVEALPYLDALKMLAAI